MGLKGVESLYTKHEETLSALEKSGDWSWQNLQGKHLIVDANGFLFFVSSQRDRHDMPSELMGSGYRQLKKATETVMSEFKAHNIRVTFVWDGLPEPVKEEEHKRRQAQAGKDFYEMGQELKHSGLFSAAKGNGIPVFELAVQSVVEVLTLLKCDVIRTDCENDEIVARMCVEQKADGVLAQDSDFLILGVPYIPFSQLNLKEGKGKMFQPGALARALGFPPQHLPLFGCMIGNDLFSVDKLVPFHDSLRTEMEEFFSINYKGPLANIQRVAKKLSQSALDVAAVEAAFIASIAGSTGQTPEFVGKLLQFARTKYSLKSPVHADPTRLTYITDFAYGHLSFSEPDKPLLEAYRARTFPMDFIGAAVNRVIKVSATSVWVVPSVTARLRAIRARAYGLLLGAGTQVLERELCGKFGAFEVQTVTVTPTFEGATFQIAEAGKTNFSNELRALWQGRGDSKAKQSGMAMICSLLHLPQACVLDSKGQLLCAPSDVLFACALLCLLDSRGCDLLVARALVEMYSLLSEETEVSPVPERWKDKWVSLDCLQTAWSYVEVCQAVLNVHRLCASPVSECCPSLLFDAKLFDAVFRMVCLRDKSTNFDEEDAKLSEPRRKALFLVLRMWRDGNPGVKLPDSRKWSTGHAPSEESSKSTTTNTARRGFGGLLDDEEEATEDGDAGDAGDADEAENEEVEVAVKEEVAEKEKEPPSESAGSKSAKKKKGKKGQEEPKQEENLDDILQDMGITVAEGSSSLFSGKKKANNKSKNKKKK